MKSRFFKFLVVSLSLLALILMGLYATMEDYQKERLSRFIEKEPSVERSESGPSNYTN